MSPFNKTRYEHLLKGLEATEFPFSFVSTKERLDSESLSKGALLLSQKLAGENFVSLDQIMHVSDGNHLSIADDFSVENGVRYLRGQDISSSMMLDDGNPVFIPDREYTKLSRSHIFKNDVLVTIVGANTGQTALVFEAPEKLTANCKLGILRARNDKEFDPAFLHAFLAGKYGQRQIAYAKRGGGQTGLILPDLRALRIPRLDRQLERYIANLSTAAHQSKIAALTISQSAEDALLKSLGLENWKEPKPLSYVRNSRDIFVAGRLDAEHFQPKFGSLISHIKSTNQAALLGSLLKVNQRGKQPEYAEDGLPVVNSKHVNRGEVRVDSDNRNATHWEDGLIIEPGDVLINGTGIGTIGRSAPYLHAFNALPDNHVTILRPHKNGIDPVYLAVFLNSVAGRLQVDQRLRGSSGQIELYPNDIAAFSVWNAPTDVQRTIRQLVEKAFSSKQRATQLLDAAKRAVEIAIEDSEAAAFTYLNGVSQ